VAITATGIFRQPERLAYLIASCARFKTIVGVETTAAAFAKVAWPWTDESTLGWPRAIVTQNAEWKTTKAGTKNWAVQGTLAFAFQFTVPASASAADEKDEYNWFMAQVGQIISEMKVLEGTGAPYTGETHIALDWIAIVDGPYKDEESETEITDPATAAMLPRWWITFECGFK